MLMIAALLAGVLSQNQVVTLDSPGWSVPQILAEVSKQTGQDFEAKDDVRNDHVIVHVDHVPIKDFMDRFAKALLCKWTKDGKSDVLKRSRVLLAQNEAASRKAFALRISDSLAEFKSELADHPSFDEKYANSFATQLRLDLKNKGHNLNYYSVLDDANSSLPLARALKKMVIALGQTTLAALPVGKRVVYSTQPNSWELALPASAVSYVAEAVKEQANWFNASSSILRDPYSNGFLASGPYDGAIGGILSLQIQPATFCISAGLTIFDKSGESVGDTDLEIGSPQYWVSAANIEAKENGVGAPVPIDVNSSEGLKALAIFGDGANATEDMRSRLLHPVETDPLSLFASGCLKALAQQKGENLIAYGDMPLMLSFSPYGKKGDFDTSWLGAQVTKRYETVEEGQGWLTAVPKDFDGYLSMRINRTTLEGLLAPNAEAGWIPIESAARFVASEDLEAPDIYALYVAKACFGDSGYGLDKFNWTMEGIYGTLRPDQKVAAEETGLPVSLLTTSQQKALLDGLMNRTVMISGGGGEAIFSKDGSFNSTDNMGRYEPTLAFANGLPADLRMRIKKTTNLGIVCKYGSPPFSLGGFVDSPEQIATNAFFAEHKPEDYTKNAGYQRGTVEHVEIEIRWSDGAGEASYDSTQPLGAVVSDWQMLPADVVAVIKKKLAIYEMQFKEETATSSEKGDGQGTPP